MRKQMRFLACLVAVIMVVTMIPFTSLPGTTVDAKSSATSSSSSGGSSTAVVDPDNYTFEKYDVPSGISGAQLSSVMNSTPLFYKNGNDYTQLLCYSVSGYAFYFYLNGESYSSSVASGYGYEALEIKDASVMSSLYKGTSKSGGSSSAGSSSTTATVLKDGTYSSSVTAYKYKKGKLDKTYYGTVFVSVSNGVISGLYVTGSDKISKLISTEVYYSYVGQNALDVRNGSVDVVSSASISTAGSGYNDATSSASVSGSSSSKKKYYTSNLQSAIIEALNQADTVTVQPTAEEPAAASKVYTSSKIPVGDEEGSALTLKVYTDDSGKIVDVAVDADNSVGTWDSLLSKVKKQYIGKNKDGIDAVTSATKYTPTIYKAVISALQGSGASNTETSTTERPKITEGEKTTYTKGSGEKLRFRSSADFLSFICLLIDGKEVDSKWYTKTSGSTIIELDDTYLDELSEGLHTIDIQSASGTASTSFTVKAAPAAASASSSGTYTGTVVSTLTDGDYIIVDRYNNYSSYYALGNSTAGSSGNGYGFAGVDVTVSGNTATVTDNAAIWTWNSSNNSFYNAASEKYLNLPSSMNSSNGFSNTPMTLTFYSIGGNEATVYVPSGNGGYYLDAAYPSNGKAFKSNNARYVNSNYLYSGSGVYFYKVETQEPKKDSTLTLDKDAVEISAGESAAVSATVGGCSVSGATSSDTGIATVSVSGNEITVTGVAAGTATITVSGTGNEGYNNPEEQTITVTVEDKPIVPEHVKAYDAAAGNITLNVTGKDVTTTTTSTTPGQTVTKGTNLVIVIDTSGSIVGKESALNSAIRSLVTSLPSNSQVGVVTFNESASMSSVYDANTISSLSFSGVENAGTNIGAGITAATSLLNGSGWSNSSNDKAMVIISDFDSDSRLDTVNAAKSAKDQSISVYSVKIDASSVMAAPSTATNISTKSNDASSPHYMARYLSSQYPHASAQYTDIMYQMTDVPTVTPGTADNSVTYVYGAGGGNWSGIFSEIQETQGITTITETTVHTTGVVIKDTLSEYVELSNTDSSQNYGIIVAADSGVAPDYTVSVSGKDVAITLSGDLIDGVTYTASVPVKPTSAAQTAANTSSSDSVDLPTNKGATLTYRFGDGESDTVDYEQMPQISVKRESFTVQFVDQDGTVLETDENVSYGATPSYDGTTPAKSDTTNEYTYTFDGWYIGDQKVDLETQVITDDTTYQAKYNSEKTGYRIFIENWTNESDNDLIGGIDTEAFYTAGARVTFTASSEELAVAAAIHTDFPISDGVPVLKSQDGTFTRLLCKEAEGGYQFEFTMPETDMYLTMVYKGDTNLDGTISLPDSTMLRQGIVNLYDLSDLKKFAADVDANGSVTLPDSTMIRQLIVDLFDIHWDKEI